MKRCLAIAALNLMLVGTIVFAQGAGGKGDWKNWSEKDCRKMLEDSPWAEKWYHPNGYKGGDNFPSELPFKSESTEEKQRREATMPGSSAPGRPPATASAGQTQVYYIVRFQSALPVRMAVVRLAQIQSGYDKMSPDQKKNVDTSAEEFINRKYDDEIVLHVEYGSAEFFEGRKSPGAYSLIMSRLWEQQLQGVPPDGMALITSQGLRVKPLRITNMIGKQAFVVYFPRRVNGQQVLSDAVKSVRFELHHPALLSVGDFAPDPAADKLKEETVRRNKVRGAALVSTEFKLDKMKMNGVATY